MPFPSRKENFKSNDPRMVSLSVYNVGFENCEPGHQWGPGVRDHFLIHHVVSGKGYYKVENQTYELRPGDSFLVYPYTEVTYYADSEDPWTYYWVGFAGTDAALIIQATDFTREKPIISASSPRDDEMIKQLLTDIYGSHGNDLYNSVSMTGALYTALSYYVKISNPENRLPDSYHGYLKRATDYIASNYSYPISIEEIADYVGVSRSHLFRLFQQHLGTAPKEYLTDFRVRQACSLLKNTDLSITTISRSVGFDDNLYFSKAFHKVKGMSPSAYRKLE